MQTKKLNFQKIGDAFHDDEVPDALEFTETSLTKLMERAKEMHNALTLVGGLTMTGYVTEDCTMLDEEGEAIDSSHYELTMEVGGSGSVYIQGESKHNGDAKISATAGCITDTINTGVAFSLKDGDNIKNIHVAYNGPKESDTILIWDVNDFEGASTAPIAIINNDGKLEIRYWQPEDMGCDPTSVTVIKPYGVYDIRLESGVELDSIDMSIIQEDRQTVAAAKMDEDGETYDIKAYAINASEGSFGFDIFRHGELVRSSDANAKYFSVRDCFFSILNKVIEQPDYLPDADEKVYCESCKMDVAFDEIGNCMNCGMPVDDWNQLEEDGEIPFIPEGAQRGGVRPFDSVEEGCPHCDGLATLKNEFHAQACSECGEMILPCSICQSNIDGDTDACINCPIEHTKLLNQKEGEKSKETPSLLELYTKDIENVLEYAKVGDYLGCIRDQELWNKVLNNHQDIYPYERSFDEYDTEWFEQNNETFVKFIEQVILREAAKGV